MTGRLLLGVVFEMAWGRGLLLIVGLYPQGAFFTSICTKQTRILPLRSTQKCTYSFAAEKGEKTKKSPTAKYCTLVSTSVAQVASLWPNWTMIGFRAVILCAP